MSERGEHDEAIRLINEALKRDPTSSLYRKNLTLIQEARSDKSSIATR